MTKCSRKKRSRNSRKKRYRSRKIKRGGAFKIEQCDESVANSDDREPISYEKFSSFPPEDLVKLGVHCFDSNALYNWLKVSRTNPLTREQVPTGFFEALSEKFDPNRLTVMKVENLIKNELTNNFFNHLDFNAYHPYRFYYSPDQKMYVAEENLSAIVTLSLYDIGIDDLLEKAIHEENSEVIRYLYNFGNWNLLFLIQKPALPDIGNLLNKLSRGNNQMRQHNLEHPEPTSLLEEVKPNAPNPPVRVR